MALAEVACIDCKAAGISRPRKVHQVKKKGQLQDAPGKRCREHFFARRKVVRARSRELRIFDLYELTEDEYQELYEFQGRQCFVCHRAKGISKKLAIDHDHAIEKAQGIRRSLRGLLCDTCNRIVIGRYDVAALQRAIEYQLDPPAQRYFRQKELSDAS